MDVVVFVIFYSLLGIELRQKGSYKAAGMLIYLNYNCSYLDASLIHVQLRRVEHQLEEFGAIGNE